jgi:hypothetical protein
MAKYNEILVGRFNRGLQKLLGIKGEAPVAQVAGEINATIDIPRGVEDAYLFGWELYGVGINLPSNALFRSSILIRNPPGSNLMAVIEKIRIAKIGVLANAVEDISFVTQNSVIADLATLNTGVPRDFRARSNPTLRISSTSASAITFVGPLGEFGVYNEGADFIVTPNQEIPMIPTVWIGLQSQDLNQQLFVTIFWRERFLEESEKS